MAAASTVSLKLIVDPKSNKVLFAEAGKDFVDFLCGILTLPVGTVIMLLTKNGMVGCLGDLYDSIENLANNNMQQTVNRDTLLKPMATNQAAILPLLLPSLPSSISSNLYSCSYCGAYLTNDSRSICPACYLFMNKITRHKLASKASSSSSDGGGYVKGVVTYYGHGRSGGEAYVNYIYFHFAQQVKCQGCRSS